MFGDRYFGARYYGDEYFSEPGGTPHPPPPPTTPATDYFPNKFFGTHFFGLRYFDAPQTTPPTVPPPVVIPPEVHVAVFDLLKSQMGTAIGDSRELAVQTVGREMKKNSPIIPNARTTSRREVSQAKGNNPPDLPY